LFSISSIALTLFFLILFAGVFLTLFDLLGTVIIFADVFLYALFSGLDKIGIPVILALLFIALIVEALDFYLIMNGAHQPKITVKRFFLAALGAISGAFIFTKIWGGPGLWSGFFLGGFATAMLLEISRQRKLRKPYRAPAGALFAMGARKFSKGLIALFMVALSLSRIYS